MNIAEAQKIKADDVPALAEALAEAEVGLSWRVGAPGAAGLEEVVVTQVPSGAFQCTATGPASPDVIPAYKHKT